MPTFIHGKNTAVYIDEFDLSSYFNDVSVSLDNDVAETTAFGDTNKAFILGTRGGTLSMSGMWEGRLPGVERWFDAIKARPRFKEAFLDWCPEALTNDLKHFGEQSWPEVKAIVGL